MKKGKILHMFPGSNTPQGFKGFLAENLQGMERVFILKGGPGCGKSTLMNKIAQNMIERGYDVEVWLCSSAPESLDGVVVPELAVAVVDGTAPHVVEPGCPGVVEEIVNLGEHWNQSRLREHKEEIKQLGQQIEASFERAYQELAEMAAVRGEQPSADLAVTDAEVTQLCRGLAEEIFGQCVSFLQRPSRATDAKAMPRSFPWLAGGVIWLTARRIRFWPAWRSWPRSRGIILICITAVWRRNSWKWLLFLVCPWPWLIVPARSWRRVTRMYC